MNDRIVKAAAAEGTFAQEAILMFMIFTEQISGQRFLPLLDEMQRFAEMCIGQNRQDRSEDFLLH